MTTKSKTITEELLDFNAGLKPCFDAMEWAEDEIARAKRSHPAHADLLYHSFSLLTLRDGMGVEFVYRSHARELLERVAAGQDTRPATAAEVVLVCSAASKVAPFTATAAGLYARMWTLAFPNHPGSPWTTDDLAHYEALRGSQIDDLEATVRHKAAVPDRRLGPISCRGMHHAEPVQCRFANHGFYDQHGTWIPQAVSKPAEPEEAEEAAPLAAVAEQLALNFGLVA